MEEGDIPTANIDSALLASEDNTWLGTAFKITACLTEPEDASTLLADLAVQAGGYIWWDPVSQKVKFKVLAPLLPTVASAGSLTDRANIVEGSVKIRNLDDLRTTVRAMYYDLVAATADRGLTSNFLRAQIHVDAEAESANEYNDRRTKVFKSRWYTSANGGAVLTVVSRASGYYRDPPRDIDLAVDAKDFALREGDIVDATLKQVTELDGAPTSNRYLITQRRDRGGRIALRLRNARASSSRFGFVAPNGTADYPTDTTYAHLAPNATSMSDGGPVYRII